MNLDFQYAKDVRTVNYHLDFEGDFNGSVKNYEKIIIDKVTLQFVRFNLNDHATFQFGPYKEVFYLSAGVRKGFHVIFDLERKIVIDSLYSWSIKFNSKDSGNLKRIVMDGRLTTYES